jgi:hypothetical protein
MDPRIFVTQPVQSVTRRSPRLRSVTLSGIRRLTSIPSSSIQPSKLEVGKFAPPPSLLDRCGG